MERGTPELSAVPFGENNMSRGLLVAFVCLTIVASARAAESPATADHLRCEYRVDPLGIDETQPRLFWQMQDTRRGAKQTAYQILVASTPEKLAADQGDLWDTGRVTSGETTQIVYAGKPLRSRMRCHWKVRLWDAEENPSPWSKPRSGRWGCSKPQDVTAKWIGLEGEMIYPGRESQNNPPLACPLFRKEFKVAGPIRRATLYASALGNLSLPHQRPAGGQRLFHARLDRLPQAGLLQHLRRDRLDPGRRPERHRRHSWRPVGTPARSAGSRGIINTATGRGCSSSLKSSWPTARSKPSPPTNPGRRPSGRIVEGEFLAGETYDATKEIAGWDRPD